MTRVKVRSSRGIRGLAEVRQVGRNWQVRMEESGDIHEFTEKDIPDGVRKGTFYVSLSARGDKWYSISPRRDGLYKVRFQRFTARDGEEPKPFENKGGWVDWEDPETGKVKRFQTDPSLSATAVLDIVEGKYEGMTVTLFVPYVITCDDDERDVAILYGNDSQNKKALRFLEAIGVDLDDVACSANTLPEIQELAIDNAAIFEVLYERGKVKKIYTGEEDDEEERETNEAPAPRSNVRGHRKPVEEEEDEVDDDNGDEEEEEEKPVRGRRKPAKAEPPPDEDDEDEDEAHDDDDEEDEEEEPPVRKPARKAKAAPKRQPVRRAPAKRKAKAAPKRRIW